MLYRSRKSKHTESHKQYSEVFEKDKMTGKQGCPRKLGAAVRGWWMIRMDEVMKEDSRDLSMPFRGLQILSHEPVESCVLPLESEREATGQGTGQRCSDNFFHEERPVRGRSDKRPT